MKKFFNLMKTTGKKGGGKHPRILLGLNFALGLVILLMINLVSSNSFFKMDLTSNNAYSLSRVSLETLAMTEDPLRVKVFYTEELPAPYNGVRRYLTDLLREYESAGGDFFSYEIIDTAAPEGKSEASRYGLRQVEIQEVRSDEFQSRAVYMGLVVLYGNAVERVDQINSTSGLEYRLTTAMRSAILQTDALSGTGSKVTMKVIVTPALSRINIQGFDSLEQEMRDLHRRINEDNYGRIDFEFLEASTPAEIDQLSSLYGLEPLSWRDENGATQRGLLEVVLTFGGHTKRIPLRILSGFFGGYSLEQAEAIEETIRQGLKSLVAANPRIAYAVGNGEKSLDDPQQGAAPFSQLLSERFEIVPIDPSKEPIPGDIETLILNGPTETYSDAALFRIDQFVMNGGNLFVLLDRHVQRMPTQQQMMAGARPRWERNSTGLEDLLKKWGAELTDNIILDEESYIARQQEGQQQLFQVPVLKGDSINRDSVVTAGLEDLIFLNTGEIRAASDDASTEGAKGAAGAATDGPGPEGAKKSNSHLAGVRYTALLKSSPKGWTVPDPAQISPYIQGAPDSDSTGQKDIAVLLEGRFESNFEEPVDLPLPSRQDQEKGAQPGAAPGSRAETAADGQPGPKGAGTEGTFPAQRFRRSSVEDSRIIVVGSSSLTTAQLLDPQSRTPNGTFLLNAVDYLNGAPGFAELRSKGLGVPRLQVSSPTSRLIARWSNTILVPLLVLLAGFLVWLRRRSRARRIKAFFQGNQEV